MKFCKAIEAIVCALALAGSSAIAAGQDDFRVRSTMFSDGENDNSSSTGMSVASSDDCDGCADVGCCPRCCPQWEATADFIIFDRIGGKSQTLLRNAQGVTSVDAITDDALNSNDFDMGFASGPRQ